MIQKTIKKQIIKLKSKNEYIFSIKNNKVYMKKKQKKKSNIKYLYYNKKIKQGIFVKIPTYKELSYPFLFNFKLISQYLNKK